MNISKNQKSEGMSMRKYRINLILKILKWLKNRFSTENLYNIQREDEPDWWHRLQRFPPWRKCPRKTRTWRGKKRQRGCAVCDREADAIRRSRPNRFAADGKRTGHGSSQQYNRQIYYQKRNRGHGKTQQRHGWSQQTSPRKQPQQSANNEVSHQSLFPPRGCCLST